MTSPTTDAPAPGKWRLSGWRVRMIALTVLAVALVVSYFLLAALVPRWWAQRVAEQVQGSIIKGSWLGVLYGATFTILPLLAVVLAIVVWRKLASRVRPAVRVIALSMMLLLAVALSAPNLMTLGIVAGRGNGAHAGERILDVEGPGFRGGTLAGAIGAALLFTALTVVFAVWRRRRTARRRGAPTP